MGHGTRSESLRGEERRGREREGDKGGVEACRDGVTLETDIQKKRLFKEMQRLFRVAGDKGEVRLIGPQ